MRLVLPVLSVVLLVACASSPETSAPDEDLEVTTGSWETESVVDETHSTHLFIVERALDILQRHPETPGAARIRTWMSASRCLPEWQQGLFDADYKAEYNGGGYDLRVGARPIEIFFAGASWQTHFYDPDSGLNYRGNTDTAYARTMQNVAPLMRLRRSAASERDACYSLGLALHYFTDITQPMHTANYTALKLPLSLHTHLEAYAMDIHGNYVAKDWVRPPVAQPGSAGLQAFFIDVARASKREWAATKGVVADAYARSERSGCPRSFPLFDRQACWEGDTEVDKAIGATLVRAQQSTAQFLALVGERMTP